MLHCYPLMREQRPPVSAYNTNKYEKNMQPTPTQRRRSRRGKKKCKPEATEEAGSRKPEATEEAGSRKPEATKEAGSRKPEAPTAGADDRKKKSKR